MYSWTSVSDTSSPSGCFQQKYLVSSARNSIVYQSIKRCTILVFYPTATKSEGWNTDGRNQHQTKEKAICIAPPITQTVVHYKNHRLHKKHKQRPFAICSETSKTKKIPKPALSSKNQIFQVSHSFQ